MTTANRHPPERIVTARLVLRRKGPADAEAIYEYASDPEVTRYMMWPRHTSLEDTRHFLAFRKDAFETGEGEFGWGITLKGEDRVIGAIGIRLNGHKADMGYVLGRKHWGKGYTTEAGRAVVAEAFKDPLIFRVWATCDVDNKASARVLEKLGMQREGIMRRYIVHPQLSPEPRDSFVYARIR